MALVLVCDRLLKCIHLCCRSQQIKRKRKESLVLPEGAVEEEVLVEEGQEIIFKTPSSKSSPEEDSASIQEILDRGSDVDDDEIEEATKRLLACTLLPDEINDIWECNDAESTGDHHDIERPREHIAENGDGDNNEEFEVQDSDEETSSAASSNAPVGYGSNNAPVPREGSNNDDAPPNEMTSLLGHEASGSGTSMASHNEEMLQPSIFTTISDIDTKRRMDFN